MNSSPNSVIVCSTPFWWKWKRFWSFTAPYSSPSWWKPRDPKLICSLQILLVIHMGESRWWLNFSFLGELFPLNSQRPHTPPTITTSGTFPQSDVQIIHPILFIPISTKAVTARSLSSLWIVRQGKGGTAGVMPVGSGWRVSRVAVPRPCNHHGEVENSSGPWWGNVSRRAGAAAAAATQGPPQAQPLNSWGKQIAHAQSYFRASGGQLSSSVIQND